MTTDALLSLCLIALLYKAYLFQRIEVAVWEINQKLSTMQRERIESIWVDCNNHGVRKFVSDDS